MTIGQWLSFQGRIGRKTFWLAYILPLFLAAIVAGVLDAAISPNPYGADAVPDEAMGVQPISGVVSLLSIWPSLAGAIKRLHDRDRSGWWVGGFYLLSAITGAMTVMMVLAMPGQQAMMGMPLVVGSLIMLAYGIWMLVETGFLRGTVGPNRYGPDPLGGTWQQPAPHWQQQPPAGWQQPPPQGQWPPQQQWQPPPGQPPQQQWQPPPQGYPPPGYGQQPPPPPGYGQPPPQGGYPPQQQWGGPGQGGGGSVPPTRPQ